MSLRLVRAVPKEYTGFLYVSHNESAMNPVLTLFRPKIVFQSFGKTIEALDVLRADIFLPRKKPAGNSIDETRVAFERQKHAGNTFFSPSGNCSPIESTWESKQLKVTLHAQLLVVRHSTIKINFTN